MGKNSSIEWTNHTFNPWWGCTKISTACENCYAERWSKRTGNNLWGNYGERRFFTEKHWQEPLRWNKDAKTKNIRYRVFCSSMADIFEDREDLNEWRDKLWKLIEKTQYLDWLLLTKRPENISAMTPWAHEYPKNVWLGVTAENQEAANTRIPILLKLPTVIRFISCEPLLGDININNWLKKSRKYKPIDWVIVGGESGPKARPTNPEWIRSLRDQCIKNNVLFHFKQWGAWRPKRNSDSVNKKIFIYKNNIDKKYEMIKDSKKKAGKIFDGRIWDQIPLA
jgi:protein gp37